MNTERFNGHTPGPWDYEIPETGDNIIIDSEGLFVAQVACRADCKNAELIAAAPDLLDALIEERKMHERLREVVDDAQFLIRDHYDPAASVAYLQIARMLKEALHGGEEE
tara:strand:+ start:245 stop:574 length:330 start_codon:yes stop_codon:yes gene_type:complete